MPPTEQQITALDRAERLLVIRDYQPYLILKTLLTDNTPQGREVFRALFIRYYGLNTGGLSEAFKTRYFEILFQGFPDAAQPDYEVILSELSQIPRRNGTRAMPFSFVSKLVGIHHENRPIYDRHVLAFFGRKAPSSNLPSQERIDWYVNFLAIVANSYAEWAQNPMVLEILTRLRARDVGLAKCDDVRLLDFLVWKVGNQRLL